MGSQICSPSKQKYLAQDLHSTLSNKYKNNLQKLPYPTPPNIPMYTIQTYQKLFYTLQRQNKKYTDEYFPVQTAISTHAKEMGACKWRRLSELYGSHSIMDVCRHTYNQREKGKAKTSFALAMKELMEGGHIVEKVFPVRQVMIDCAGQTIYSSKVQHLLAGGFYCLELAINGGVKQGVKVLVDDYIPVDQHDKYLYGQPQQPIIWMMLLEKAVAKVVGSYSLVHLLSPWDILQTITGYPNLKKRGPVPQYIKTHKHHFLPHQFRYLTFTMKQNDVRLVLWVDSPSSVLMELFWIISDEQVIKSPLPSVIGNKIVYEVEGSGSTIEEKNVKYLLHIYNLGEQRDYNLTITSQDLVCLYNVTDSDYGRVKRKGLEQMLSLKQPEVYPHYLNQSTLIKIVPQGHRYMIMLKNLTKVERVFKITIKEQYRKFVVFQLYNKFREKSKTTKKYHAYADKWIYAGFIVQEPEKVGIFYSVQDDSV